MSKLPQKRCKNVKKNMKHEQWIGHNSSYSPCLWNSFFAFCVLSLISQLSGFLIVMGSIDENWYRYSIDTQISFRKSPSRTSHWEVRHIFRRISTFGLRIFSKSLGFFNICPVSASFQVISFQFCFLGGHFWSLFQWQYQVSIPK